MKDLIVFKDKLKLRNSILLNIKSFHRERIKLYIAPNDSAFHK